MGTEITEIRGRHEKPQIGTFTSIYEPSIIHLNSPISVKRFWGGTENGVMAQLTMNGGHVQLNREQMKELIEALMECLHD